MSSTTLNELPSCIDLVQHIIQNNLTQRAKDDCGEHREHCGVELLEWSHANKVPSHYWTLFGLRKAGRLSRRTSIETAESSNSSLSSSCLKLRMPIGEHSCYSLNRSNCRGYRNFTQSFWRVVKYCFCDAFQDASRAGVCPQPKC
jgi:hypothetical protein